MRNLHLTNEDGRNTLVNFASPSAVAPPTMGRAGEPAKFKRYLAASENGRHEAIVEQHGDDYAQALIEGDPEVDLEQVGRILGESNRVFLEFEWQDKGDKRLKSGAGRIRHAPPAMVEVLLNPDGSERSRGAPKEIEANINEELPIHWTGKKMPKVEALKRFVFIRSLQLFHRDGLTYDYLFGIASELASDKVVVLLGAGAKGNEPLVFQANGTPYRGFLEGRVKDKSYQLLLHLSNMELKRPS